MLKSAKEFADAEPLKGLLSGAKDPLKARELVKYLADSRDYKVNNAIRIFISNDKDPDRISAVTRAFILANSGNYKYIDETSYMALTGLEALLKQRDGKEFITKLAADKEIVAASNYWHALLYSLVVKMDEATAKATVTIFLKAIQEKEYGRLRVETINWVIGKSLYPENVNLILKILLTSGR